MPLKDIQRLRPSGPLDQLLHVLLCRHLAHHTHVPPQHLGSQSLRVLIILSHLPLCYYQLRQLPFRQVYYWRWRLLLRLWGEQPVFDYLHVWECSPQIPPILSEEYLPPWYDQSTPNDIALFKFGAIVVTRNLLIEDLSICLVGIGAFLCAKGLIKSEFQVREANHYQAIEES
jgi:hypothetical protein